MSLQACRCKRVSKGASLDARLYKHVSTGVSVCACVYVRVPERVCVYACAYLRAPACGRVYTFACVRVRVPECVYVGVHVLAARGCPAWLAGQGGRGGQMADVKTACPPPSRTPSAPPRPQGPGDECVRLRT